MLNRKIDYNYVWAMRRFNVLTIRSWDEWWDEWVEWTNR